MVLNRGRRVGTRGRTERSHQKNGTSRFRVAAYSR
jgi:hypothetical protein